MEKLLAYIDEFGTNSLDVSKEGVSSHFILSAILLDEKSKEEAHQIIESVRSKYFQKSEIKSSKIKNNNPKRRLIILKALSGIKFIIYSIVVDKKAIASKGLSFKESFYKYFHKELINDLNRINSTILFSSDEIGSEKFMGGFIKYLLASTIQYSLFDQESKYQFVKSEYDDLMQLSDFVVGSLGKTFNLKEQHPNSDDFLEIIKDRLHVKFWPDKAENYLITSLDRNEYDKEISELGLELVYSFIKSRPTFDDVVNLQIQTLNYLRLMHRISPKRFIPTYELMFRLGIKDSWSLQDFRRKIIGNLRDQSIIIVSSRDGGYKLPISINDINQFINRYNSILQPMIGRLGKCRDSILIRTMNKLDILDRPEYQSLRSILDVNKHNKFAQ